MIKVNYTELDGPAGPTCPRLAVTAAAPQKPWVEGAFEFAKAGFALLAERYPDHVRFADLSGRGEQAMVDLQMFAEGGEGAPALSHAQAQQAIASGTMRADEGSGETLEVPAQTAPEKPEEPPAPQERPAPLPPVPGLQAGENAVRALHARWAAEEEPRNAPSDGAARDADGGCLPSGPLQ